MPLRRLRLCEITGFAGAEEQAARDAEPRALEADHQTVEALF